MFFFLSILLPVINHKAQRHENNKKKATKKQVFHLINDIPPSIPACQRLQPTEFMADEFHVGKRLQLPSDIFS